MTMKFSVVTGGAGFIGSHLCDELIKNGDDVICLDNFLPEIKIISCIYMIIIILNLLGMT